MKPYIPDKLPIKTLDYSRLLGLVGRANAELARYDGLLQGIVNPEILLSPLTTQEAVLSSKIEGTQATLDEVLEHEAGMKVEAEKEKDWNSWVVFFLGVIAAQASTNGNKVREIMRLYEEMKKRIVDITHSHHAITILDALFSKPIFSSNDLLNQTRIPKPTAAVLIRQIREKGILFQLREASGQSGAVFVFKDLLNIAEGRAVL